MDKAKMKKKNLDFNIPVLGKSTLPSPILLSKEKSNYSASYTDDDQYILYNIETKDDPKGNLPVSIDRLEKAGPRAKIYFDPTKVRAGVVTCGGLCPGLNDVIRAIVMCLWYRYGVKQICGFQYGYRGFLPESRLPVINLTPDDVSEIHRQGGTLLGSSRGSGERVVEIVDSLERMNINMLFTIGGDGTQKGALAISEEIGKRNLKIAVVGIPKTIDNDLNFVQRSFGFETAVSHAANAVASAHVEARGGMNGIGIVKVMGRYSGFIAAHTALAINDVNYVLIPEVPFDMEGENGLLSNLERRLEKRKHAVILVSEGAGQEHMHNSGHNDASGNKKLNDIGVYLKGRISNHFKDKNMEINLKYIDPSYMIRSAPANPNDSIYCARLGANAAHAAMAGKTGLIISLMHDRLVHIPIQMAVSSRNCIDPNGELWRDVIEATGQSLLMKERRSRSRTSRVLVKTL